MHISVITAVLPSKSDHLHEAWLSLRDQALPDGSSWEWLLQIDGPGEIELTDIASDERVRVVRTPQRYGPAIARTLCMGRLTGSAVKVLDADDQLTEGQLAREIAVLEAHSEVIWITSRVVDLREDGSTQGFPGDPEPGILPVGSVLDYWLSHDYRASVHPATLMVRSWALLALGGWMALPASEDTGLLLSLDALWPGYFLSTAGLIYRKWPKQLTVQSEHLDSASRDQRFSSVLARLEGLKSASW